MHMLDTFDAWEQDIAVLLAGWFVATVSSGFALLHFGGLL